MAASTRFRSLAVASLSLLLAASAVPTATSVPAATEGGCSRATGPVYYAPGAGKTVALSFDDGPTKFTPQVLRILREHHVRATFFVLGRHAAARPKLLQQVADEGHLIAGHTYDHYYPSQVEGGWTRRYITSEMRKSDRVLSAVTGGPICFFRPPGGNQTSGMYDAARARGVQVVLWSVSSGDSGQPGRTTAAATDRIVRLATTGGSQQHPAVLMHDGKGSYEPESEVSSHRGNTVKALPRIIAYYRSRGYRFVDHAGRSGLPREHTTLEVAADPVEVPAATRSVLRGTVTGTTGPVVGREVTWFSRRSGATRWRRGGEVVPGSEGRFRLPVRPRLDTEYLFLLPASTRYRRAADRAEVTTYTESTEVVVSGPAGIVAGETVTLVVAVTSEGMPRTGVVVRLSRVVDGVVVTDRATTDEAGRATFTDQPAATTRYTAEVRERLPHEAGSATHDVVVSEAGP